MGILKVVTMRGDSGRFGRQYLTLHFHSQLLELCKPAILGHIVPKAVSLELCRYRTYIHTKLSAIHTTPARLHTFDGPSRPKPKIVESLPQHRSPRESRHRHHNYQRREYLWESPYETRFRVQ